MGSRSVGLGAVVAALCLAVVSPVTAYGPGGARVTQGLGPSTSSDPAAAASAVRQAKFRPLIQENDTPPAGTDMLPRTIVPDAEVVSLYPDVGAGSVAYGMDWNGDTNLNLGQVGHKLSVPNASGSLDVVSADFDAGTTDADADAAKAEAVAVSGRCADPVTHVADTALGYGHICLSLFRGGVWNTVYTDLRTAAPNGDPNGNATSKSEGRVRLATGDVDADGTQELVLAYDAWTAASTAAHLKLQVFEVVAGDDWLHYGPSLDTGNSVDPTINAGGGVFAVTAGDVDTGVFDTGTSKWQADPNDKRDDEIVLIWDKREAGPKYHVAIQVFKDALVGGTWQLSAKSAPWDPEGVTQWTTNQITDVSITTGRFDDPANAGPRKSILYGWANSYAGYSCTAVTWGKATLTFELKAVSYGGGGSNGWRSIRVAAADLDRRDDTSHLASDGGGLDEAIAVWTLGTTTNRTDAFFLVMRGLELKSSATLTYNTIAQSANAQLSMGTGRITPNLDDVGDATPQIVVSAGLSGSGTNHRVIRVFSYSASPSPTITLKTTADASAVGSGIEQTAIAVGDLDGDGLRLGAPKSWTVTNIRRPVVIVKAAPAYFDVVNGQVYDPSNCYLPPNTFTTCGFGASYGTTHTTTFEANLETHATWDVSAEASGGFKDFGVTVSASMKYSVGGGFSRTSGTSSSRKLTETVSAQADDLILAQVLRYEVLEYPVIKNGIINNYVKLIKPIDPMADFEWLPGSDAPSWLADDEPGNLLSYPTAAPAEWSNAWPLGNGWTVARTGTMSKTFVLSEIKTAGASTSIHAGIEQTTEVGAGYGPFTGSLKFDAKFDVGATADRKTTLGDDTQETVTLTSIAHDTSGAVRDYVVKPFFRYDSVGAIVLDYVVVLKQAGPGQDPTFWDAVYKDKPDPALTLPKRLDCAKAAAIGCNPNYETKSLWIEDPTPAVGEDVRIVAKIRNYSLSALPSDPSTMVHLWLGDPNLGGSEIGSGQSTGAIPAQGSASLTWHWTVPAGLEGLSKRIYAVIDPENAVDEIHEDNNKGWAGVAIQGTWTDVTRPTVTLSAPTASATRLINVTVGGSDTGGAGLCWFAVVNGTTRPLDNDPAWTAYPPTTLALTTGDGTKTISAFSRDCADNYSDPVTRTVLLTRHLRR